MHGKKRILILAIFITLLTGCSFFNEATSNDLENQANEIRNELNNLKEKIHQESDSSVPLEASVGDTVGLSVPNEESFGNSERGISDNQTVADANGQKDGTNETVPNSSIDRRVTESESSNANTINGGYAYSCLQPSDRVIYEELYHSVNNMETETVISTMNTQAIEKIFQCVLNDHPELFYIQGYEYTIYSVNGVNDHITVSGKFTIDATERKRRQVLIDEYINTCIAQIDGSADEYTKIKGVYDYIINHTEYDLSVADNQNICSVCMYGASVCQGYAKTFQYILNKMGVWCTLVLGTVSPDGGGHAWNLVKVDGDYYYVDPTWGDVSYLVSEGAVDMASAFVESVNYDYFCVTSEVMNRTHVESSMIPMPIATATSANYFVHEGAYFSDTDEEKMRTLFQNRIDQGAACVTFRCSSADVFNSWSDLLLSQQKIFEYLGNQSKSVVYLADDQQYSFSFALKD